MNVLKNKKILSKYNYPSEPNALLLVKTSRHDKIMIIFNIFVGVVMIRLAID